MRKVSKILIGIIISLFGIQVVNADNCENIKMTAEADANGYPFVRDSIKMTWSGSSEGRLLTFKDSSGKEMPSYCHNVSKPTGARYGSTIFLCSKEIFDSTKVLVTSDIRNIYDAGLMKILVNGYNVNNKGSGVVGYTATDLAVKTYELLFPTSVNTNNMNSGTATSYLKAYKFFANKMLDDSEVSTLVTKATGSLRNKYSDTVQYSWASNSDQIESRARELLIIGLNEAIRFKQNGAASISWNDNPVISKDISTQNNNTTNYSGSIEYTFKINNFTSNGAFANATFKCDNCSSNGVNYNISVNGTELGQNYTSAIDLLSKVDNGSGEVTIKVSFNTTSRSYSCEELDYSFVVNYRDETISNEAYEMRSTDRSCSGNACQPIYVLRNSNIAKQTTIKNTFSMCSLTCEELKSKCNSGNSKACTEYRKQYPNGCINCGVGIKNNECADPGSTSTLDLIEGYEIDPTTCTQGTEENITGCILENKDAAGNDYTYIDNGICSVSCKEDFHFVLPGNLNVLSGRYLPPLQTDVKATKTCYLKMKGDPSSVLGDFEKGVNATHSFYTACARAKAIGKLSESDFRVLHQKTVSCGEQPVRKRRKPYQGYSDKDECMENGFSARECTSDSYFTVMEEQTTTIPVYVAEVNIDGGCCRTCSGHEYFTVEPEVEYVNGTCQVTGNVEEALRDKINSLKIDANKSCEDITNLNSVGNLTTYDVPGVGNIKAYIYNGSYSVYSGGSAESIYNGLGAFNACTMWDMTYDFNPELFFSYEESAYMKEALTRQLDLIGDIKKGNVTKLYCRNDDKDSSYKSCSSGWQTEPLFTTKNYCICTSDGCKDTPITISDTRRMKESITYEASYITPTQFYSIYPTGAIVVAKSCDGIENCQELKNTLPIGLGTSQGVRKYALYAKNLGEYYNSGKYGRIWDIDNIKSVTAVTLKSNDKCIINGALKYDQEVYEYIKNGVWVCNYCINGDCGTNNQKCTIKDGKYYGINGEEVSEEEYNTQCNCPECPLGFKCAISGGKYYGINGTEVTEQEFQKQCDNCPDCPVDCPTCIYSKGKNFNYRSISLDNLNPNNRNLGANWTYSTTNIDSALKLKSKVTTDEIINDGETIYDDSTNKYVMKVTLDSAMINKIKSRKDKEYTNNTLKCYDYKQDGSTYKNIFCYSTYIDELLNDSKTKNKITFSSERPLSESQRTNSQNSEYWTTWTRALESSNWNINTTKELSYYKTNYSDIGIGPSWK